MKLAINNKLSKKDLVLLALPFICLCKLQLILNNTLAGFAGLGVFVFITFSTFNNIKTTRFLLPTFLSIILTLIMPINVVFFLLITCTFLLAFEMCVGKISLLSLASWAFMSSLFAYVANSYTFSIRLMISQLAAHILRIFYTNIEVQGTMFIIDKTRIMHVESGCMGLNMLSIGMIFLVFLLAFYQNKNNSSLHSKTITLALILAFVFIIINNLIRIVGLVLFDFNEQHPMHQLFGLLCFVAYFILPLIYMIPKLYKNAIPILPKTFFPPSKHGNLSSVLILISVSLFAYNLYKYRLESSSKLGAFGIQKIEESNAVIYKKSIPFFYSAEHNPLVCWQTDGYVLQSMDIQQSQGQKYYYATLTRNKEVLYTAWWFSDGKIHTTNQYVWRWQALVKNKAFKLISVTSNSRETLQNVVPVYLDLPQPLIL